MSSCKEERFINVSYYYYLNVHSSSSSSSSSSSNSSSSNDTSNMAIQLTSRVSMIPHQECFIVPGTLIHTLTPTVKRQVMSEQQQKLG